MKILKQPYSTAANRVNVLFGILKNNSSYDIKCIKSFNKDSGQFVTIGDVSIQIKPKKNPHLIPILFKNQNLSQTILKHLQWMMQKDILGQDIFLIGPPGALRRNIAMIYLELTGKEVEYVALSRDSTETDLKQRREIKQGTAMHINQPAVRAAIEGRTLILEGIEKAERNVLPILNNLLENREMQLEDGRFLVSAERYDKMLQSSSAEELNQWKLVRVHEDFRVIALGLPVPRYHGNSLDPPLRSRFQARDINHIPFQDNLDQLKSLNSSSMDTLSQLLSCATLLTSKEMHNLGLPDFPIDNLHLVTKIMQVAPNTTAYSLIHRLYPYSCMLNPDGQKLVRDSIKKFGVKEEFCNTMLDSIHSNTSNLATIQLSNQSIFKVPIGQSKSSEKSDLMDNFVNLKSRDSLLADIIVSHSVGDFCIIGPRGCGKSMLVQKFANLLGYNVENIMLYQDMTARELLQQRRTTPDGDTGWMFSPLISAALEGGLAVLDGLHRINAGTFAILQRLIQDREISLFDGTRLLRCDKYEAIKDKYSFSDKDMHDRSILKIHPSFRIIGLSEAPEIIGGSSQSLSGAQSWLNPEMLTMFLFHQMKQLSVDEEKYLLQKLVPNMSNMSHILDIANKLRSSNDLNLKNVATSFSTRQLVRIAIRLSTYENENYSHLLQKVSLLQFIPKLSQEAFLNVIECSGIQNTNSFSQQELNFKYGIKDGILKIGRTSIKVHDAATSIRVPDVVFYDNKEHIRIMEDMLKDFLIGEHLLLVGNQGVGKNKIVDRFLNLLNRPREYIQLHRDTTVQSLTLQPTVLDGIIRYEDSPLVRAVKYGHVLVVDEADKAATNVTCILKTLVESGQMHLSDGRRIVSYNCSLKPSENLIIAHPDFRMIVLANRPGFPFLGNDFFATMGDIFSCHAVENPDAESEMSMLSMYGPNVPQNILQKLVAAFGELRSMADGGLISYPFSTREVVSIVKHLQRFPNDSLINVINNVFDFDTYDEEKRKSILEALHKHGFPIGANTSNIHLIKQIPLPELKLIGQCNIKPISIEAINIQQKRLSFKEMQLSKINPFTCDRHDSRSMIFSEEQFTINLPLHETSAIVSIATTKSSQQSTGSLKGDIIHVLTTSPLSLYSCSISANTKSSYADLQNLFPNTARQRNTSFKFNIASLPFPHDNNILIHEAMSNNLMFFNYESGKMHSIEYGSLMSITADKIARTFKSQQGQFKMCNDICDQLGIVLLYKDEGNYVDVIDLLNKTCTSITLPFTFNDLYMCSPDQILLFDSSNSKKNYMLSFPEKDSNNLKLEEVENFMLNGNKMSLITSKDLSTEFLSTIINQKIQSQNRIFANKDSFASVAVGFPNLLSSDIYSFPRNNNLNVNSNSQAQTIFLPQSCQLVQIVDYKDVPIELHDDDKRPKNLSAFLEIVDLLNKHIRYLPLPGVTNQSIYNHWYYSSNIASNSGYLMTGLSNDSLATVDSGGCIRLFETSVYNLTKSINQWKNMIGNKEDSKLQVTYDKEFGKIPTEMPKHGMVDPTGAPHVGGNTFAGGTGGMRTAGLGGVGGPYRLDGGSDVYQVSDWDKSQTPPEIAKAAREMAERAWKERLKQIKMSEYDGKLYDSFAESVRGQIKSLRVILDNLQAKGKERQWLKHQTFGDFDESKLIEGMLGEKSIYKRRGEKEPEPGSPQQKPKLMRILCDVSGSMYRFNGQDGRLDRQLEAVLMVMEAFEGYQNKLKYELVGHSGEGPHFPFMKLDNPPKNNKERLDILLAMHAHAQFCASGDHTLEATKRAIDEISKHEADEKFLIVLSDANLERYGIRPTKFSEILTSNADVNSYVIFIGSLGDQADRLKKQLPSGHAFICFEMKNLPSILQQIFTSTLLK